MDEIEQAEVFPFISETKFAAEAFHRNIADDEIGLGRSAISNDGALDAGNDGLNVGLVEAEDGGAVKRNAIYELGEDRLNLFERAVLVEMLAIDCGDDGDDGRVIKE